MVKILPCKNCGHAKSNHGSGWCFGGFKTGENCRCKKYERFS